MKFQSVFIGLSILASATTFAEKITLKMKYTPGDKYVASYKADTLVQMGGAQKMEMHLNVEKNLKQEIFAHEKAASVEVSYESVKLDMKGMGQNVQYDSTKKNEGLMAAQIDQVLKPLLTSDFKMIVDTAGSIVSVDGVEGAAQLKSMGLNPEDMVANIKTQKEVLPKEPVKVGDKWDAVFTMPLGSDGPKLEATVNMELISVEEDLAKIKFSGKFEGGLDQGGKKMEFKSEKYEGLSTFNITLGQFSESKISSKMIVKSGDVENMTATSTITITLSKEQ